MASRGFRVVRDQDNGFAALFEGIKDLKGRRVKVGIQGREAAQIRPGGISMVQLATIHEFGAPNANIPQRSFMRSTADTNKRKYERMMAKSIKKLVRSPETFSVDRELLKLGETVRADIIKTVKARIPPPNKQATIDRKKGEDVPLIDTGLLINSIRAVVT